MFFSCFDFSCFEQWSQRAPSRGNSKDIIHYTQLWHTFFKLMNFINSFCVFSFLPLDFAHRTASVHAAINIRHIFLVNYIQIFNAKKAYQLHQTWIHFSNNYGNILRFSLVACCLLFPIVLRGTATKCGLKSNYFVDSKCHSKFVFNHAICLRLPRSASKLSIFNTHCCLVMDSLERDGRCEPMTRGNRWDFLNTSSRKWKLKWRFRCAWLAGQQCFIAMHKEMQEMMNEF